MNIAIGNRTVIVSNYHIKILKHTIANLITAEKIFA